MGDDVFEGVELSIFAGSSAGSLPKRLEGCAYDAAGRNWVPKKALRSFPKEKRSTLLHGFTHLVEKAPSAMSTCKRCGEKIGKGEVRVGYPVRDQRGEYSALPLWLHVKCARCDAALVQFARTGESALNTKLLGHDVLSKEDRSQLTQDLTATEEAEAILPPSVPSVKCLDPHPKPAAIQVELLPFQAEGLGWMLARESDQMTRGGILADEMGMGKTLQMISVLVAGVSRGPNLVVCPAAALLQWRNEIVRFVEPGTLEVELYYGFGRKSLNFNGRDKLVVLTTYQTLEADFRQEVNRYKVRCEWCERYFLPEKLGYHQKYFCGPDAERTEKQKMQEKKTDLKSEAVKRMKIGGTETEITLNPLTQIRRASAAALRTRRRTKTPPPKQASPPEAKTSPRLSQGLPFPAAVLPDEARAALSKKQQPAPCVPTAVAPPNGGLPVVFDCKGELKPLHFTQRPLGIVVDQRNPLVVTGVKPGKHAADVGVQVGWTFKSIGGDELALVSTQQASFLMARHINSLPVVEARGDASPTTPSLAAAGEISSASRGRGRGRGVKRRIPPASEDVTVANAAGAATAVGPQTPSPSAKPPPLHRRWSWCRLQPQNSAEEMRVTASSSTSSAVSAGIASWGGALRRSSSSGVIRLDGVGEDDSDLELVGEQVQEADHDATAAPVAASRTTASTVFVSATTVPSTSTSSHATEGDGDVVPPRPSEESDDDNGYLDLTGSPLFATHWGRVVLDEAHRIKGRINSTAQAAFHLRAACRWCLSGTPLQNRVGEVYSVIRFLRFYPFAHYFCSKRGCKCCSLHYRFDPETSLCRKCGHTKMQHRSHFAGTISNPIKKFGFLGAGRKAMECLRGEVLDRILLRRTKAERHNDLRLPPMHVRIRRDTLSAEENDFYQAMYMNSLTKFDTYVDKGTILHNYAHVFDLIMRLRQAVDHPYLIVHGSLRTESGPIPTKSRSEVATGVCALCQDDFDDSATRVVAQCGHPFHRECVADYIEQAPELPSGGIGCPACFAPLTVNLEDEAVDDDRNGQPSAPSGEDRTRASKADSIMHRIKTAEFKSSTKIEALMQEITRMMANPNSKALVFSQFVTFLEMIEWRMKREGVSCAKLLGSMSCTSKSNIVISFQTDPTLKVLLISLKAGGEGLNLQAADHIFLMDPWWNPASEMQAIQRAHRIGQTRPVYATRFVASGTIEEKIIELQEKKQTVFDCSVGNSNQALQRLTGEDIKFLFSQ